MNQVNNKNFYCLPQTLKNENKYEFVTIVWYWYGR